jgi:hypothetical protein
MSDEGPLSPEEAEELRCAQVREYQRENERLKAVAADLLAKIGATNTALAASREQTAAVERERDGLMAAVLHNLTRNHVFSAGACDLCSAYERTVLRAHAALETQRFPALQPAPASPTTPTGEVCPEVDYRWDSSGY